MEPLPRVEHQRFDGIPHADEADGTPAPERLAEAPGDVLVAPGVVDLRCVLDEVVVAGIQQSALVEHPGQGAHGEGAAAEPEQVHVVAFVVAVHQAAVGVLDVLLQAVSGGLIAHGAELSTPFVVLPAARADAGVVVRDLPLVLFGEHEGLHDVRIVLSVFVAGPVAADDDVLHRIPPFAWRHDGRTIAQENSGSSSRSAEARRDRNARLARERAARVTFKSLRKTRERPCGS